MIGYTLKNVLELVPEALSMIKQAHVDQDFPLSSKDDCLASALVIEYNRQFKPAELDIDVMEKVAQAVTLYDLEGQVKELGEKMRLRNTMKMEKSASIAEEGTLLTKIASWEGDLSGMTSVREMAERAEVLFEKAAAEGVEVTDNVRMYACDGYLSKQAALDALNIRYSLTEDTMFVKLAAAVGQEGDVITSGRVVKSFCNVITKADEKHGLNGFGFNIYKEAMITKQAGFTQSVVKIAGREYPLHVVLSIPPNYLDDYLGKGLAAELKNDPASAKHLLESLPADSQQILATILKNA